MDRKCECCGETLKGRSDKRFCNDACRSQHYHLLHRKERTAIADINRILRHNRRVLQEWRSIDQPFSYRESLLSKGFSFEYYTHSRSLGQGRAYYCYDLGYLEEKPGRYRLISD